MNAATAVDLGMKKGFTRHKCYAFANELNDKIKIIGLYNYEEIKFIIC